MSLQAADMPGADELMLRIYATMAQKERELIGERTRAALAAAKAGGTVLGGDRGYRPGIGPDAAGATLARTVAAERAAHLLALEVEAERVVGAVSLAEMAVGLKRRGVSTPRGQGTWTHITMARVLTRAKLSHSGIQKARYNFAATATAT